MLYKLQLIETYTKRENPFLEHLLQMYYGWSGENREEHERIQHRINQEQQRPSVHEIGVQKERIHLMERYIPMTKVYKLQQQYRESASRPTFTWKLDEEKPLTLYQSNYFVIQQYRRFYKHDFYGRRGVFICSDCQEKTNGYLITENDSNLVTFCFLCEFKYFKSNTNRDQANMISFAKNALKDSKVMVRMRGGGRQTLDQQNVVGQAVQQNIHRITNDYVPSASTIMSNIYDPTED